MGCRARVILDQVEARDQGRMVGENVGPYTILSELGRGSVGIVYLAEHRHLKRKVAIKFLQAAFSARSDLLQRFFTEARAASLIDHGGIIRVLDCDVHTTGNAYIVMEYLAGETLGQHLVARGKLSVPEAAAIVLRVADALAAAHNMGIVHRDLKPDNIFLLSQPPGAVKIVDFGIAKLNLPESSPSKTLDGLVMGTPLYMSPEQARGAGSLDARSDVYSLGCILFELLCGRPPFVYSDSETLLAAHMSEPPPSAESFNRALPGSLTLLLEKMLAKSPDLRPRLRDQVIPTLESVITGRTTLASKSASTGAPVSPPQTPGRRLGFAFWLAVLGVVGLGGGAWWWQRQQQLPPEHAAESSAPQPAPIAGVQKPAEPPEQPAAAPPAPSSPSAAESAKPAAAEAPSVSAVAPSRRKRGETRRSAAVRAARASQHAERVAAASSHQRTIQVSVATDPPDAVICLSGVAARLGTASAPVSLKANAARTTLLIYRRGYQIEKLILPTTDKDVSRSFKLRALADDDLQPPPPCR